MRSDGEVQVKRFYLLTLKDEQMTVELNLQYAQV